MKRPLKKYAACLSIAGSDPSGGAGIQADLKTFTLLECYGQAVPTALTVQNSLGVKRCVAVDADLVYEQVAAVMEDLMPQAVKIGMLPNAASVQAVAEAIRQFNPPFTVLDPIMLSTSGLSLTNAEARQAVRELLMPLCSLITPNLPEALSLAAKQNGTPEELAEWLSKQLSAKGVLVKGGHTEGEPNDVLYADHSLYIYRGKRIETANSHGTGCVLSSAIAACMAQGATLPQAVERAKAFVTHALQQGADFYAGKGHGAMYLLP